MAGANVERTEGVLMDSRAEKRVADRRNAGARDVGGSGVPAGEAADTRAGTVSLPTCNHGHAQGTRFCCVRFVARRRQGLHGWAQ